MKPITKKPRTIRLIDQAMSSSSHIWSISAGKVSVLQGLFLSLLFCGSVSDTAAKSSQQKKSLKYTKLMTPIFDTSLVPKPSKFRLQVRHTQIIFPVDRFNLLHGDNRIVNLSAVEKNDVLRGQVEREELDASIMTKSHDLQPRFFVDLRRLEARYAPEMAYFMQTEIEAARLKTAERTREEQRLMELELRAVKPFAEMPLAPSGNSGVPELSAKLNSELSGSRKKRASVSDQSAQSLNSELISSKGLNSYTQQIYSSKGQAAPKMPACPRNQLSSEEELMNKELKSAGQYSSAGGQKRADLSGRDNQDRNIDTSIAEKQMAEQIARAKLMKAPLESVQSELAAAQRKEQRALAEGKKVIDCILTSLRPFKLLPADAVAGKVAEESAGVESILQWDEWHERFAGLARGPILRCAARLADAKGQNTVKVTVFRNHHLEAAIYKKSDNADFDMAILGAYQSLDGNQLLAFPEGSRRSSVSFLIDIKHEGKGVPSSVISDTLAGDREVLHGAGK